jgi:hypothetical protein
MVRCEVSFDSEEPLSLPDPLLGASPVGTVEDPYLPRGSDSYFRALAFDTERIRLLVDLINRGLAERVDDDTGIPHVVLQLGNLTPGTGADDPASVEAFFRGALPWHSRFRGRAARFNREIFESIRDEWRDTGRVRLSMFEIPS